MNKRLVFAVCGMFLSLSVFAQASGGQIARPNSNKLPSKKVEMNNSKTSTPKIKVISEASKTCELYFDAEKKKHCINIDWKNDYQIPMRVRGYKVVKIGDFAFEGCAITGISIPESIEAIGKSAFGWCKNIKEVIIPSSVKSIGSNAFQWCLNIKEVIIPSSVKSIGSGAFCSCENLILIEIPGSVKKLERRTFLGCKSLSSVQLNEGLTNIGSDCFYNCDNIKKIQLPNSLKTIEDGAFYCTGITSVTLPEGIISIGNYAFYFCSSLKTVKSQIRNPFPLENKTFSYVNATLYVPSGCKERYIRAGWDKFFTNIIEE